MMKNKFISYMYRYLMLLIGMSLIALAVSIITRTHFGTSPVQSLAFAVSVRFSKQLTFGTCSFLWNCVLIIVQLIVLRKEFKLFQLLQLPLSFFFGAMVDLTGSLVNTFFPKEIILIIGMLCLGFIILSMGIYLTIKANVIMNSPEAATLAISRKLGISFGKTKLICDGTTVILTIIFCFIFFREYRSDIIGIATISTVVIPSILIDVIANIDRLLTKRKNNNT